MENLKLKFKLHGLEFEIEGKEDTVKEEFSNFKEFITGQLLPQVNIINPQNVLEYNKANVANGLIQAQDITTIDTSEYPVLKEVVKRNLPKSEPDWVLIYCFYASSFGEKSFTELDIKKLYKESERESVNRFKNFAYNFKSVLTKQYINVLNETDYLIKMSGIERSILILKSESVTKKKERKKSNKNKTSKKSSNTTKFNLIRNLDFYPDSKISLRDFANNHNLSSNTEKILLIVFYLQEILKTDKISINHIYTGFDNLNEKIPKSLYQQISDTKNKNGWLDFSNMEDIKVSVQGRNYIKLDLKNKND